MKKIFLFLIGMLMVFSFQSCMVETYATTQDDIYVESEMDIVHSDVSFDVVIRYGVPYYMDGILLYYLYHDIYYYPFYYDNYWYVRAYRRPFTHFDHRPYFRPHKHDYRFAPGHHPGFDRPRGNSYHREGPGRHRGNYNGHDGRPHSPRPDAYPNQPRPDHHSNARPAQPRRDQQPNIRPNSNQRSQQRVQPTQPQRTHQSPSRVSAQPRSSVSTPSRSSIGGSSRGSVGRPSSDGGRFGGRR